MRRDRAHLAPVGHQEAGQHGEEGGLPGRGRPDHRDGAARRDDQVEPSQHVPARLEGEVETAGLQAGRGTRRAAIVPCDDGQQVGDRRRVRAVGAGGQHPLHAVPTGEGVGQVAQREADDPQRPDQQREEVHEAGDVAEGRGTGLDPGGTDEDQEHVGVGRDGVEEQVEGGPQPGQVHLRRPQARGPARAVGRPRAARRRRP